MTAKARVSMALLVGVVAACGASKHVDQGRIGDAAIDVGGASAADASAGTGGAAQGGAAQGGVAGAISAASGGGGQAGAQQGGASNGGSTGFAWPTACDGRVDGTEAMDLVAHGAELIDVRSASEYATGHIEGAVNIPLDELQARMAELDPSRAVVVYCASGSRADAAADQLCKNGYQVYDLGPRSNWPG